MNIRLPRGYPVASRSSPSVGLVKIDVLAGLKIINNRDADLKSFRSAIEWLLKCCAKHDRDV